MAPRTENKDSPLPLTGVFAAGVFAKSLSVSLSVTELKLEEMKSPARYVGVLGIVEEKDTDGLESFVLSPLLTGELFSDRTLRMPVGGGAECFSEQGDLAEIYG